MIHHISIAAKNPRKAADTIAEIMNGFVVPAPPTFPEDSWFILTGDKNGTLLEVTPYGTELRPEAKAVDFSVAAISSPYSPFHALISVEASVDRVIEIGEKAGWITRRVDRGPFEVIECWVENTLMLEIAPPELAQKYIDFFTDPLAIRTVIEQNTPAAQPELVTA
ncbi:MAG TPA: hypothetical protein VEF04_00115 [Blastocatellia bacterium]|nr:hypothetical protein [Blastocatellia bacterium]